MQFPQSLGSRQRNVSSAFSNEPPRASSSEHGFLHPQAISPLQAIMLADTLAHLDGRNIEQVEISFAREVAMERVIAAWMATVKATTALRANFLIQNGEPVGIGETCIAPDVRTLGSVPERWEDWLDADRLDPLPLEGRLPWRVAFWPKARKFVWTFHHALLDGRSITRIVRSFCETLEGLTGPRALSLSLLPAPDSEHVTAAAGFHAGAFAEVKTMQVEVPSDVDGGPVSATRRLGAENVTRLETAARRMGVTAPALVTWAWGQAVARLAGAEKVAVGQVRSGPPRPNEAGFSMNTVPLVLNRLNGQIVPDALLDFSGRLLEMRAIEEVSPQLLPAGSFQECGEPWPGGVIMVERGTMKHQLLDLRSIEQIELHEFSGEPLLASAWLEPDLLIEVEASGKVFGRTAVHSLLDHWASIITALAEDEATGDPTRLPDRMNQQLAAWESMGSEIANLHLSEAWRQSVGRHSHRCAIFSSDGSLTYGQLNDQVEHLAARLHAAGVVHGTRVASLLRKRRNLASVLLAISRIGAIQVPLDPALPTTRLRGIIDDSSPALIVTDDTDFCADFNLAIIEVDGMTGNVCTAAQPTTPRDPLSLLYTSGSTGQPKAVMMVHGGVTNEAFGIAKLADIRPDDRFLQFASPGFDASLEELLTTLLGGATLVPRPGDLPPDLDEFYRFIQDNGLTILDLSTAHWAAWCSWMVSENVVIPACVRVTIIGGERASAAAVQDWFKAGGRNHRLINTYGPTEASVVATAEVIDANWNESGDPAIGQPLPGVVARVADAAGNALPPGIAGELWLGGICVGPGYWQRPEQTASAFREIDGQRWYRTGDRVFWDTHGKLRFLGRQDEQLKIRGNRIEPNEVIRILEAFPGVSQVHVGPVAGPENSVLLAAWVRWEIPTPDGWTSLLANHAAVHLAAAAVPGRWAEVAEFKLTERGKLDRKSLPNPLLTASNQATCEPPGTPTERWLAEVWSELLGVPVSGRDESFFDLGGHSLAALRMFARVAGQWRVRIPMAMLAQAPTPRLLGALIDHERASSGSKQDGHSIIVPLVADGNRPPLFCIHGGDGGVLFYRNLAPHLPEGCPLMAIEAPALALNEEVRSVSIEATARDYITALRQQQPAGPYHLVGYSYGGLLVYEIARQLMDQGETVAFAGLVDTVNPAAPVREYTLLERAEVFWEAQRHPTFLGRMGCLLNRARAGFVTRFRISDENRIARNAGYTEPYSEIRMLQVREAHWESMTKYQPLPYDGPVTLFKSRATNDKFDLPSDYGWGTLVNTLDVMNVPGEHLTVFHAKHIATLAGEIVKRLS